MGYRSDVAIAFYPKDTGSIEVIEVWFDVYKPELKKYGFLDDFEVRNGVLLFQADDVKWYSSYPDVALIERMVDDYKTNFDEENYCYEYIRIGEDNTDIEEHCSYGFMNLSVSRSIEVYV